MVDPNELDEGRATNLRTWDARVPVHIGPTSIYGIERYVHDPSHISDVVAFDQERLGDVAGLDVVHLQCHIGTDTLSLARLGATVTGVDFSLPAVEAARDLFLNCGAEGRFVEADVYSAPEALGGEKFDIVYTGVGALPWLPDIDGWAVVVAELLKPGGRLLVRDQHPMLFTLDQDRTDGALSPMFPYFPGEPFREERDGTYADTEADIAHTATCEWNHSLASVVNGLIAADMRIDGLHEHDSIDWIALPQMVEGDDHRYRLPDHQAGFVPLMFTVEATRT